jgi:thymidylate synthase
MRGDTDASVLQRAGVHIWDGNTSREFLDNRGLQHLPEGDIGAGYGHQWRRFGGIYRDCKTPPAPEDGGVDQLAYLLEELRTNPFSRRIFMSAWNPEDLCNVALPPCHVSAQFYVDSSGGLSCHMYQRSVDAFLGFPWNILSYSVFTYIIAAKVGLRPNELIVSTGDTHIYTNHLAQVETQLAREPYAWPQLQMSAAVATKSFEELQLADFEVVNYQSHPFIKADMAV